jgi:hypothetical protein
MTGGTLIFRWTMNMVTVKAVRIVNMGIVGVRIPSLSGLVRAGILLMTTETNGCGD